MFKNGQSNRGVPRGGRQSRNGFRNQEQETVNELCKRADKQIFDRRRQLGLIRNNRDAKDAIEQLEIELRCIERDRQTLVELKQATKRLLNNKGAAFLQVKKQCETLKNQKKENVRGVAQIVVNNQLFEPIIPIPNLLDPEVAGLMNVEIN